MGRGGRLLGNCDRKGAKNAKLAKGWEVNFYWGSVWSRAKRYSFLQITFGSMFFLDQSPLSFR